MNDSKTTFVARDVGVDSAEAIADANVSLSVTVSGTTSNTDDKNTMLESISVVPPPPSLQQPPLQPQRRRLVGRAARRRRRKFKEICVMERILMGRLNQPSPLPIDTLAETTDTTFTLGNRAIANNIMAAKATVLPIDRDHIWPAVLEIRHHQNTNNDCGTTTTPSRWTKQDNLALMGQLGYVPGNAIQVVCRVKDLYLQHHCSMEMNLFQQQQTFDSATTTDDDTDNNNNHINNSPVVVQLYPMVYRNPHAGGKSGGKRFKLRKRQKMVLPSTKIDPPNTPLSGVPTTTTATTSTLECTTEKQRNIDDSMLVEPFPTIYWLTHPLLRCIVSKLELEGFGLQLERRLQDDDSNDAVRMMQLAHGAYGQERYQFLSESDRQLIQEYHWETAFATSRGVAGISKNCMAVKCLHAHLAHYLSNGMGSQYNIVGQWVWEEILQRYTEPPPITAAAAATTTTTTKSTTSNGDNDCSPTII
jgi:hypothetical protein